MRGECRVFRRSRATLGMLRLGSGFILVLLLSLAAVAVSRAQTSIDGAIRGTLTDSTGALLPNVAAHLENTATGLTFNTATGDRGEFLFSSLPVGDYTLTLTAQGFAPLHLLHVTVEIGAVTQLQPHLHPAAALTISIAASDSTVSTLDLPSSATSSVITPTEIDRLPVDVRRWQTFALLTPTANPDPSGSSLVSFRGVAVTQNSTSVDAASNDQSYGAVPQGSGSEDGREAEDEAQGEFASPSGRQLSGSGSQGRHAGAAYTFSQEAVREFRVSGQNYSALYGHAAGGVISTVSKSGSNRLHGSAFYLARSSAWAATDPFALATHYANGTITSGMVKPHDLRQQFGGSIGGAAIKDSLFFFYAFDAQRRGFPAVSSPGYAAFYALTPTQLALLGNRGVRQAQIVSALDYIDSLTGLIPRRSDQTINFGRLDWQQSPRNSLGIEYNRARSSAPAGTRTSPVVDRGIASVGNGFVDVDGLVAHWTSSRSSSLSNALTFAWSHDLQYETAPPPLPQEPAIAAGGYAPRIAIGPQGFIFGTASSLGRSAYPDEQRFETADLVEWTHGHHLIQLGADVSFIHDRIDALYNVQGSFHYDSGILSGHAGGLVDWITDYTYNVNAYPNGGCPSIFAATHDFCFRSFSQSFGVPTVSFSTQEWAGFVQESWTPRPSLSIHAGVRYEYELLPLPQQPNPALDVVFGAIASTSRFPEDRNNLGPRVGVAWEPFGNGQGIVRLGYGLFYGRLPGATIRSALIDTSLPTSTSYVRIVPTTITNCPQVANQGFGYACTFTSQPPAAVTETSSSAVFDRRFRLPAVQQGSLTLERSVPHGSVVGATYLLNLDRQLPNSVDINIAPSTDTQIFSISGGSGHAGLQDGQTFVLPVYKQRVSSSFGPVTDIVSNANASYNALVVEARQRSRHGLEFRVSYTWSKALDFGQSGATPRTNGQFDPFNIRYDHGLSSLNYPHKVLASAVWEPGLATPRRWLRMAVNGWMLAPLFVETSGHNYSYDIFGGARLPGGHTSINGSGGARYLPTIGRNTLRLPDTANLDLRLSRTQRLGERVLLRANAEAFNLANHVNYSAVSQRAFYRGPPVNGVTPLVFQDAAAVATEGLNILPFGSYTAAATVHSQSRQVQLGVRLEF